MLLRYENFRTLPVDAVRDGDQITVTVDVPGVDPSAIDVQVDRRVLTISAARTATRPEGSRVLTTERAQGRLIRRLALPETVDASAITAAYDRGVLTLHLPLAETAKPRRIELATPQADSDAEAPAEVPATGAVAA